MATRRKRQTNVLHDNTTGTVNITPSSNPAPQNTGFFDRSFTNTGSSSRRRRRRRLHARARQQAAHARAAAEAQAQAEQQARAQAHAQAAEQARAQAAAAQAQREQAYRQAIRDFTQTQKAFRSDLAQRYDQTAPGLPAALLGEIQSDLKPPADNPTRQQSADLILQEKSRINYLLARKQAELEQRNLKTLAHGEALSATTPEQYRHYLESRSQGDQQRAQQAHQAWTDAVSNAHEARLLAESVAFLEQRSTELSERHARMSQARPHNSICRHRWIWNTLPASTAALMFHTDWSWRTTANNRLPSGWWQTA